MGYWCTGGPTGLPCTTVEHVSLPLNSVSEQRFCLLRKSTGVLGREIETRPVTAAFKVKSTGVLGREIETALRVVIAFLKVYRGSRERD